MQRCPNKLEVNSWLGHGLHADIHYKLLHAIFSGNYTISCFLRYSKDPNSQLFATWLCKVLEAYMRAQNLTRADLPTQARTLHVGEFRHHGAAVAAAAPRCPPHSLHAAAQLRLSKAVNSSENALTGAFCCPLQQSEFGPGGRLQNRSPTLQSLPTLSCRGQHRQRSRSETETPPKSAGILARS